MTATETEMTPAPAVEQLTDKAIVNEIAKLGRMIATRQEDVAELNHEITELSARRDALINVQIERLKKTLSQVTTGIEGE